MVWEHLIERGEDMSKEALIAQIKGLEAQLAVLESQVKRLVLLCHLAFSDVILVVNP